MGKKTAHFEKISSSSSSAKAESTSKTAGSSRSFSTISQYSQRIKKVCREHSYCYKPSNPSYYPVGLPWSTGKLKCIPGYCNLLDAKTIYQLNKEREPKVKKTKFIKTLIEKDEANKEELKYFLQIAYMAGDYDENIYDKMDAILQKMRQRSSKSIPQTDSLY